MLNKRKVSEGEDDNTRNVCTQIHSSFLAPNTKMQMVCDKLKNQ